MPPSGAASLRAPADADAFAAATGAEAEDGVTGSAGMTAGLALSLGAGLAAEIDDVAAGFDDVAAGIAWPLLLDVFGAPRRGSASRAKPAKNAAAARTRTIAASARALRRG